MTLGQGHDTAMDNNFLEVSFKSKLPVKSNGPDMKFCCVYCDLDLGVTTLGQGHDTPLGHGQQLSEVLFKSKLPMKIYGPDTEFGYVYTVILSLEL